MIVYFLLSLASPRCFSCIPVRGVSLKGYLSEVSSKGDTVATSDDAYPQQVILILSKSPSFLQGRILQKICYPSQRLIFLEECARFSSPSSVFLHPRKIVRNLWQVFMST